MKKTVLVFSALIIGLLTLFKVSKYSVATGNFRIEFVIAFIAVFFFLVGVFYNKKVNTNIDKEVSKEINTQKIKELEITSREYEVLELIAQGFSNKEIADVLFLSESTIKTHVSNLLIKLNAKRRTQAVQIAKELLIIE